MHVTSKRLATAALVAVVGVGVAGCGSPSEANIKLRKENATLRDEITTLKRDRTADRATIKALQSQTPSVATLNTDRLDALYTAHGLQFGRLTGGANLDPDKPGDDGLKVYVVPIDRSGDQLKAAGAFTVEAFDLAASPARIGEWTFDEEQSRKLWVGGALIYDYVLPCPWQTVPRHKKLTVKVTFTDALTQRQFTADKPVEVKPPPLPATQP